MKKIFSIVLISGACLLGNHSFAQTDSMSNGTMKDPMPNSMNNDSMHNSMKDPMPNGMNKDSMHNGMTDPMPNGMNNNSMMNNDTTKKPEDKSKRPSPPAMASSTIASGAMVNIDYSQPSVKGREIGKGVEPHKDSVWRTGANEATVFAVDKDVTINGKALSAGKYGFFTIWKGSSWTIIFNKTWDQWGAFDYKASDDVLRVDVKNVKPAMMSEKMTFMVDKSGKVSLAWGNVGFDFMVK